MNGLNEFSVWYDAIYLVPGGVALLVLLLSAVGGGMHRGHHGVGHHGVGHHGVGHHGAGHHAPALPTQVPVLPPPAQNTQHMPARLTGAAHRGSSLLSFFGLGRVPAPLVWGSALLGWGVFGFWGTQFWRGLLHYPVAFFLPALATALAGAFLTQKVTVETAYRFLPRDETSAVSAVELCGMTGTVVFPVDDTRGRVYVYDVHGTLHDLSARTSPGQEAIARGRTVLVADYDAAHHQMIVEEAP